MLTALLRAYRVLSPWQVYLRIALRHEPRTPEWRRVKIAEAMDARWADGRWETRPHTFTQEEAEAYNDYLAEVQRW